MRKKLLSDKLKNDRRILEEMKELTYLIDYVQHFMIIINENDEILHANKPFLNLLDSENINSLIGYEVGDIVKCEDSNANSLMNGSVETDNNQSIEKIISTCKNSNREVKEECRIWIKDKRFAEFLLVALPLNIRRHNFIVLSFIDISETRWREALERIFFHDILNSAGALRECINLLDGKSIEENEELLSISRKISNNLIDEIISQKQFLMAERDEYVPNITEFDCDDILTDVSDKIKYSFLSEDKNLKIVKSEHVRISSDRILLSRAIYNLVKNALEATPKNGTVELFCIAKYNCIEFMIRNDHVIPKGDQEQIFNKSFSTKGMGRGLGTYSAKFISEKFLKGNISFESNDTLGTIFYAVYPLAIS